MPGHSRKLRPITKRKGNKEDEEGYVIPVINEVDWNGLPVPDEFHQEVFMKIESELEDLAQEPQEKEER